MNQPTGLLFPGQGSQYVGMGADLYEQFPTAREIYDRAEDILELPVKQLSFSGPENQLRETRYTQPAILVHSMAALACLPGAASAVLAAGHSLGEYSALYAAGALDFRSALLLVKRRGELMFAEGERNPGTMAAIIGLDAATVELICRETPGIVVPANYNEPRQTVISGEVEAVKAAAETARQRGALKVVMLPVSGAFHSPLLTQSATEFAEYLAGFPMANARFPVIANVTAEPETDAARIRTNLSRQLISPVRWTDTILTARTSGCRDYFEVGPGSVLAGLTRRIDRELNVRAAGKASELTQLQKGG